jgi:putative Flp pilus-assembly TadE/G-like protein
VSPSARSWVRRIQDREDGATAVIVGILILVIIGLLALAVDGGVLWTKYRRVRTANDAASLAAAYSCASGEGLANANIKADQVAGANVNGAAQFVPNSYPAGCNPSGGSVTVRYHDEQELLFGQAVGISSPKDVVAKATATWGGSWGANNVAPLMLSMNRLSTCGIPYSQSLVIGQTECFFWWDNGTPKDQAALTNAEWGLLDLDTWGVTAAATCPGNTNQQNVSSWIADGFPDPLLIDPPPFEYVCRGAGFQGNALNNDINAQAGQILWFPVNDPQSQVQANGTLCRPNGVDGACSVHKYAIVGFAALKVVQVWTGQQAQDKCSHPAQNNGSLRCLETVWMGFQSGGLLGGGGGPNLGVFAVALTG